MHKSKCHVPTALCERAAVGTVYRVEWAGDASGTKEQAKADSMHSCTTIDKSGALAKCPTAVSQAIFILVRPNDLDRWRLGRSQLFWDGQQVQT
ncbi:hypothetical protein J1614_005508 [Plenodomus biglobosus]|nr:hypothetical protein J1614_005508 [Plenodomus biglobosus]